RRGEGTAGACSASRFSIQLSRNAMTPPDREKLWHRVEAAAIKANSRSSPARSARLRLIEACWLPLRRSSPRRHPSCTQSSLFRLRTYPPLYRPRPGPSPRCPAHIPSRLSHPAFPLFPSSGLHKPSLPVRNCTPEPTALLLHTTTVSFR